MQPTAQMSTFSDMFLTLSFSSSGAMKQIVPHEIYFVFLSVFVLQANPKSVSLMRIFSSSWFATRTFYGLRSRCTMFLECKQLNAMSSCLMMQMTYRSLKPCFYTNRSYRSPMLTYSMTIKYSYSLQSSWIIFVILQWSVYLRVFSSLSIRFSYNPSSSI